MHPPLERRILRNLSPSNTGAAGISPNPQDIVKSRIADLSALPVVAVASSSRNFGIACVGHRLTALRSVHATPRRTRSGTDKVRAIIDELEEICSATAAATLLLESGKRACSLLVPDDRKLVRWAESRGIRVACLSTRVACLDLCDDLRLSRAVARLASRYPELERRVTDTHGLLVRSPERWRHLRPLVVAFALAHTFAARSVIKTFAGENSPTNPYDPRHP